MFRKFEKFEGLSVPELVATGLVEVDVEGTEPYKHFKPFKQLCY
jgi:hypothetical protein